MELKHWKISYAIKNTKTDDVREAYYIQPAHDIMEAIDIADTVINKVEVTHDECLVIYDVGIMEDDVF